MKKMNKIIITSIIILMLIPTFPVICADKTYDKSQVNISIINGGMGFAFATITNNGEENIHNIEWVINVKTRKSIGPNAFDLTSKGIIPILKPDFQGEQIRNPVPFGFALIKITVNIQPENEDMQEAVVSAILLGKLVLRSSIIRSS